MDDLATRRLDLFGRYPAPDLRDMAHMTDAELWEAYAPFRRAMQALYDEYGRAAVEAAMVAMPTELPTLN
jgi:hypothetical protein